MKRTLLKLLLLPIAVLIFSGCDQNSIVIPKDEASTNTIHLRVDDAIISLANQLSKNKKLNPNDNGTMTMVSFVDLQEFKKTSRFGMVLSESLYNELFVRGFNITDVRGQQAISINDQGEFYITRNISNLKSEVSNTYIVIGTYSKIDEMIMINARILDNKTGKIISSARAMYANDDCSIYGICNNASRKIKIVQGNKPQTSTITKPRKIIF
jgi:TolB-like protein